MALSLAGAVESWTLPITQGVSWAHNNNLTWDYSEMGVNPLVGGFLAARGGDRRYPGYAVIESQVLR